METRGGRARLPEHLSPDALSVSDVDYVTWTGEVKLPVTRATPKLRVTFEEYERIQGGAGHGRIVFTESIPVN